MPCAMQFISEFLATVEGACQTRGYIPCHKRDGGTANYRGQGDPDLYVAMGASGVTIATGCDLGQTNRDTLMGYGLSEDIARLFSFYYGKKRERAIHALHSKPLVITEAQARCVDQAVHAGYLNRFVRPAYEKDSGLVFDELPKEAQAVIMSLCFQKGCGGVRKDWPKVWGYLCKERWAEAAYELKHGFTQYVGRRKKEGNLLEGALNECG